MSQSTVLTLVANTTETTAEKRVAELEECLNNTCTGLVLIEAFAFQDLPANPPKDSKPVIAQQLTQYLIDTIGGTL